MKMLRTLVLVFSYFSLAAGPAFAFGSADAVRVGDVAPVFSLADPAGATVSLADFKGKVVFLNFWATWCPPCRTEMPSMERLNGVFSDKDFAMLAVNIEREGKEAVPAFLERNPYSFTILLDIEEKVQRSYGVYRFPETFLIDRNGRVARHYIGAYDWSTVDILKQIKALIDQTP